MTTQTQTPNKTLIDHYRHINVDHFDWWEHVYDWFQAYAKDHGIEVDEMYFSGFWSQGDGACFNGGITNWPLFVAKHPGYFPDATQTSLLADHAKHYFRFTCKRTGRYCHEKSVSYDVDFPMPESSTDADFANDYSPYPHGLQTSAWLALLSRYSHDDIETSCREIFEDYMQELYRALEKEYDHLTSDEAVWEAIVANDLDNEEENNDE